MKKYYILSLFLSTYSLSFAQNPIDDMANRAAHSAFDKHVLAIYKKALACKPIEVDLHSRKTAREWMKMKPEIPHWAMLSQMQTLGPKAQEYARKKKGTDKIKHCFAGCFVAQNADLKSAIMTGWLKELIDSSDCSKSTNFEESDYYATAAGGVAGKKVTNCEDFCHRSDIKKLKGEEMYQQALLLK
jgi:hypothetical protein